MKSGPVPLSLAVIPQSATAETARLSTECLCVLGRRRGRCCLTLHPRFSYSTQYKLLFGDIATSILHNK